MLLAHELVIPEAPATERWMLFLHGILGRRVNWRSFARRWVKAGIPDSTATSRNG